MGTFSIWHWLVLLIFVLPAFLPLIISRPKGPNRYGSMPPPRSFGDAIAFCMKNYVGFNGRGRRSEYWWFYLFTLLISIGLGIVDVMLNSKVANIASLVFFLPSLAASSRRLHDNNRSGWWILIGFGFGIIPLIFMWTRPSQEDSANVAQIFE